MTMSQLDPGQIIKTAFDDTTGAIRVEPASGGLVLGQYDYIALTYYSSGPGNGQIQTVTYQLGGSGGTVVATLTLAYDGSGNLSTVTKS